MLWRVRATLHDRPGALAGLTAACGDAGVNILGLQIFPGVDRVTDELVVRTPYGWGPADLAELVTAAGGAAVSVIPCTEAALTDQPTRYVHAARTLGDNPAAFPDLLSQLFDAEPEEGSARPEQDELEVRVRDTSVHVRRGEPFTATERARASALAELVSEMLTRRHGPAPGEADPAAAASVEVGEDGARALVAGHEVGHARWAPTAEGQTTAMLTLHVDPAWRRLGIGSRLLQKAARGACGSGVEELVLRTGADNTAVLPLVTGLGLRGRIRVSAETMTVRIPIRQLVRGH